MSTYRLDLEEGDLLRIGFGRPALNDEIVRDASNLLNTMIERGEIAGGKLLRINGPATMPVSMVIAHGVGHLYGAVAMFDPKLSEDEGKYVVVISHDPEYQVGSRVR